MVEGKNGGGGVAKRAPEPLYHFLSSGVSLSSVAYKLSTIVLPSWLAPHNPFLFAMYK